MNYNIDEKGYYGEFGGAYIPEMLYPNIKELQENYLTIMADPAFQAEFNKYLKDYVGRPTPLFLAERLSEKFETNVYLKREDLNHTGAHKVNNTLGQILLAKRLGKKRRGRVLRASDRAGQELRPEREGKKRRVRKENLAREEDARQAGEGRVEAQEGREEEGEAPEE